MSYSISNNVKRNGKKSAKVAAARGLFRIPDAKDVLKSFESAS